MTTSTKKKIAKQTIRNGHNAKMTLTPFERDVQFNSFVEFNLDGRKIGAYLCRKKENSYKLTFVFNCKGINPTITDLELDDVFDRLEGGFKDIPDQETLTIHLTSFAEDIERQLELNDIIQNVKDNKHPNKANTQVLTGLLFSEKERIKNLRTSGLRKPKTLRLFCSYTFEPTEGETDLVEKVINNILKFFRKNVTGEYGYRRYKELNDFFATAYRDGFKQWERVLSSKMGLAIEPLAADEIWQDLWKRFNKTSAIPVPHVLLYDGEGITEEKGRDLSTVSLLLGDELAVPIASRNYVYCNGKFQGTLLLAEKHEGWSDKSSQLRSIWSLINEPEVNDTEVFAQILKGNQRALQEKLSILTKQSISKAADAANNAGTVNVKATVDADRAVEAQQMLYEGNVPLRMCTAFIVHRSEAQELEDACNNLAAKLMRPAWLLREVDYAWTPWLQTFPGLVWDKLYSQPYDRRFNCLTSEVSGFIPIVKPTSPDDTGFELIASEGNQPIFLDVYSTVKHLGAFATTRAGKSVLVSGILTHALAAGMPVSILDYPRADGTGTFSEYVPLLGGSYFNIATECLNLFELPNLKQFDVKAQEDKLADFQDSILEILLTIILGSKSDGQNQQEVRSILVLAMSAFFGDIQIQRRYSAASTDGFGSIAWKNIPTIRDYLKFCALGRLPMSSPTPKLLEAIETINLRLTSFIETKIGRALSSPSTFKCDAQLFAIALANLGNQEDALIIAMSANLLLLRRSLGFKRSLIFVDEVSILCGFDAISEQIGKFCANGAKDGIGMVIAGQEVGSIAKSKGGDKILATLALTLIGRIKPEAVDGFVQHLKLPKDMVSRCAGEAFYPKKDGFYSQWLLFDGVNYTPCRYYPGFLQLAAVANNPPETAIRLKHMKATRNPVKALIATANELLGIEGRASP
jgi:hypothetical protein